MKFFLLLVVIAAAFLWLAPKLLSGLGGLLSPAYVVVDQQTAVQNQVQSHSANRGKYRYTLAGRPETFDFDNFQNEVLWEGGRLGSYLADGDSVQKAAGSTTLQVIRHGQVSDWTITP